MNKIVNLSFVSCIFFSLSSISFEIGDFYFYYLIVIFSLPLLFVKYKSIDKWIFLIYIYLLINGLLNVLFNNNSIFQFIKVYTGSLAFYLLYFYIIKFYEFKLVTLFELYYRFSIIHAYIGLIQFVSYLVGFEYGYDFSWFGMRTMDADTFGIIETYPIHGLISEPAGFVIVQSCALYFAVGKLSKSGGLKFGSTHSAFIIIITFLLSLSSTGYFALILVVFLHTYKKLDIKRLVLGTVISFFAIFILYSSVPKLRDRVNTLIFLAVGKSIANSISDDNTAGSSVILFNHFLVSFENAKNHFFGTGMGSHHVAFGRYNKLKTWFTGYGPHSMVLNLNDASSLLNRIMSEMGFFGLILTIYFIFKFYIRQDIYIWTSINHASLVVVISHLLRGGHYFIYGLPFFILSYYYSHKFSKD